MFKRLLIAFFIVCCLFLPKIILAQEKEVNLYFFWSGSCPHCAKEKAFIQKIAPDFPNLKFHDYEVSGGENIQLLQKVGRELNIEIGGVPITIIGNSHFVGYLDDETTGKTIIKFIKEVEQAGDPDLVGKIIQRANEPDFSPVPTIVPNIDFSEEIKLPILGSINSKTFSLPVLTLIIAALDGFNPCAMWTLLFLISLLLGMRDRKRMWILGSVFIISSAFVYFLFLTAWLNLFLFLGFVVWVRIAIGILAAGAGSYYLYDFFKNKTGGCKMMGDTKRQKVFERIRKITQRKEFLLALGGMILLAFAVNLVELVCSAGLPAIYTQILSMSHLSRWQYYGYLLLYILIFMLDDLFIFFAAMITLQATGIQSKHSRFSHLVGGVLMLIIGVLLLVKPEILMFV